MKLASSGIVALAVAAVAASPQEQPDTRYKAAATAVTVDVVVRDQRGRPVTDLGQADFQLLEDGVPQQIRDITLVADSARSAVKSNDARAPAATAPLPGGQSAPSATAPTFVALVFDRLSPEARALAHKGALSYLGTNRPQDFAGVFLSDLSLVTIQTYTTDRALVRKGIDDVASRVSGNFDRLRITPPGHGDTDPGVPPTAGVESPGRASTNDPNNTLTVNPGLMPRMTIVAMMDRMERAFEAMSRDQQGHATINSLLAVVSGLGELPGRKSVIFFAEALAIPPNVQSQFESVVATANRLNVSVYSVDAAGLRVHSSQSETARRIGATEQMLQQDPEKPNGKLLEAMELNEDNLRRDPAVSLRLLAERTGGFLINNTNDLAPGLRRVDEDRHFHYLLTYAPRNTDFRGEWRRITVKVPSRSVTVRARSGYLAVRSPGLLPLLAYEGPALAALERIPLPADVPLRAGAFVFPQPGKAEARVAVLVATDGGVLANSADKAKGVTQTDFTVLARLKDVNGDVLRKGSQRYRLPANLQGEVLFFRQPTVPPGSYTLEYVVNDALGHRAGAGTAPVIVQGKRDGQPQVSGLMIVGRTERVPAAERDATNPLYYGDLLLYPNLGEPISKRQTPALTFAFNMIPGPAAAKASLALFQGERVVGESALPLGAPDADGRIWHVGQLPVAGLSPGDYALAVTVTGGGHVETRRATFRMIE